MSYAQSLQALRTCSLTLNGQQNPTVQEQHALAVVNSLIALLQGQQPPPQKPAAMSPQAPAPTAPTPTTPTATAPKQPGGVKIDQGHQLTFPKDKGQGQ